MVIQGILRRLVVWAVNNHGVFLATASILDLKDQVFFCGRALAQTRGYHQTHVQIALVLMAL